MMYPEANISRSTIQSNATGMDPNLAQHYYYPTPERTEPEIEDDAGLRHPNLQAIVNNSDDIFLMTDQMLGERFSFGHEIGFGNWGSVWVGKPRHYRASTLEKRIPGGRMGRMAAANGGYGAGGKVAFKLIYREKTAVSRLRLSSEPKLMSR
jgi:protein-serine/threonine kinase